MDTAISDSDSGFNMGNIEDECDVEYLFVVRAVFANGRSENSELDFTGSWEVYDVANEISGVLWDFKNADSKARIAQLSPDQRETHEHWLNDATECRCGGVCGGLPCTYDTYEQAEWLENHTRGGVVVEWRWFANRIQFTETRSARLTIRDFEYDESGELVHNEIARELGSFVEELEFDLRNR